MVNGVGADPGSLIAVDGTENSHVTEASAEWPRRERMRFLEVLAPEILVASLASLGGCCVVALQSVDRAGVGYAD